MKTRADAGEKRPFLPRRYLPLLIVLLVAGLLSLLLHDFFRAVIFIPLLEFVLYYYRLYRSLNQDAVWTLFLILAGLIALRALWRRAPQQPSAPDQIGGSGRLAGLVTLATEAEHSDYARWQLIQSLEELTVKLLEQRHGQTAAQIRRRIAHNDIDLPSTVQLLFSTRAAIPNYRTFHAARVAAQQGDDNAIPLLRQVDLDAALQALEAWE